MNRRLKWIGCLGLLAAMSASGETPLSIWNDFDARVAAEYEALANDAPCYPPGDFHFGVAVPPLPFDASAFADMTNSSAPQTLAGVPAWMLVVQETQDVSRVWNVVVGDVGVVREIPVPPYDPMAWSQNACGVPPEWLAGVSLAQWYRERARERVELRITLIPADRFDDYRANLGTVGGLYAMVRHPILTAQGLAGAIAHPVQTANAVADSVADTWSSGNRGQGQIVGNILIAAATVAAPYAKAGGTAKAASVAKASSMTTGGRVFWSGGTTARDAAEAFAQSKGGLTLEMTRVGKVLDAITTTRTYPYVKPLWNKASQNFARKADEAVDVFHSSQGVRLESVWRTVEYPELIKAGTPINFHVTP